MTAPCLTGFTLSLSLIVAIGAQNAFVLRQGLRREHLGLVVAVCALLDVLLMAAGVFGLGALVGASPRVLDAITLAGAAVLVFYGVQALRRALAPGHLLAGPGAAGMPRAKASRRPRRSGRGKHPSHQARSGPSACTTSVGSYQIDTTSEDRAANPRRW